MIEFRPDYMFVFLHAHNIETSFSQLETYTSTLAYPAFATGNCFIFSGTDFSAGGQNPMFMHSRTGSLSLQASYDTESKPVGILFAYEIPTYTATDDDQKL